MSANDNPDRYMGTEAYKLFGICNNMEGIDLKTKSRRVVFCAQRAAFAMACLHNKAAVFNMDITLAMGLDHASLYHYEKHHEQNMTQRTNYGEKYKYFYSLFTAVCVGIQSKKIAMQNKVEKIYARAVLGYI